MYALWHNIEMTDGQDGEATESEAGKRVSMTK